MDFLENVSSFFFDSQKSTLGDRIRGIVNQLREESDIQQMVQLLETLVEKI